MEKLKNVLIVTLSAIGLIILADIICFVLGVFGTLLFAGILACSAIGLIVGLIALIKELKKIKKKKLAALNEAKAAEGASSDAKTGNGVLDLYGILGIPVQYNKDGTVKDIYQLLGIEPEFDENGIRMQTPYELLGIAPRFSEDGKEIPSVFVIKNRASRPAKVDLTSRVLVRKLSDQEKEAIAIRETLKKKLDEAEQNGDKNQEEAIKKMLEPPKKPEEKKEEKYKPVVYKAGKGNSAIKAVKAQGGIKPSMLMKMTLPLSAIFEAAANSPKHAKTGEKTEPKVEEKPKKVPEEKKVPTVDPKDKNGTQVFGMKIYGGGRSKEIKSFVVSSNINIEPEH